MPSSERLGEFAAVVQAGSISAAARALELPRATLSRRITALEAELGVRLLHRSTRRLVLTDAGRELDQWARRIVADCEAAWRSVQRLDDTPRGLLRISATAGPLDDLLLEFVTDFPEVQVELRTTNRHVDLIGEGVDVGLRVGPVTDPGLIVRRIASSRRLVVGSSAYLRAHGVPTTPADLADHACIRGFAGDLGPQRTWPQLDGGEVEVSGPLAADQMHLARRAARAGLGLAFLPWIAIHRDVHDGRLTPVLLDSVGIDHPVSLVFADREYIEPKVRVFVDRAVPALKSAFGTMPPLPRG